MKRTLLLVLTMFLATTILLSGCQPSTGSQVTEEPQAGEPTAAGPVEEPMAGEVTEVIGFTSSLTGNQEVSSKRQVNGFTLWLNQTNEAGGITLSDGTVVKFDFKTYDP